MPAGTTLLTRADLDRMPEDGNRYELVEGEIVVAPSPRPRHQIVSAGLFRVLDRACPEGLIVLYAPLSVMLDEHNVVEPDLLVLRADDLDDRGTAVPPRLAIEILSPGSRRRDLAAKKRLYERAGVPSYWVVDPGEPDEDVSLTAWELRDGAYVAATSIAGDEEWTATLPFEVTLRPADLAG